MASLRLLDAEDGEAAQEVDGVLGQLLQLGLLHVDLGDEVLDAREGVAVDAAVERRIVLYK